MRQSRRAKRRSSRGVFPGSASKANPVCNRWERRSLRRGRYSLTRGRSLNCWRRWCSTALDGAPRSMGSRPARPARRRIIAPAEATAEAPAPQQAEPTKPAPQQAKPAPKETPQAESSGRCDYQACARKYQSFRASDCTYQPYGSSERRACEKTPSHQTAESPFSPDSLFAPRPEQRGTARCNVAACSSTYESFDPGSCTYQPYDGGPRRACTK